jgi:hypothetical protein
MTVNMEDLVKHPGVAIAGKAGVGKNTFGFELGKLISNEMLRPVNYVAFADEIAQHVRDNFTVEKSDPGGRELMLRVGMGKREEDPDYWVRATAARCDSLISESVYPIITDMRFSNELEWARRRGFYTVRIDATGMDRGYQLYLRGEEPGFAFAEHPSETELDEEIFDVRFWNPHGDNGQALRLFARRVCDIVTGVTEVVEAEAAA